MSEKPKILHFNLKAEYFHAIKSGTKPFEFRLDTAHWRKRLEGRVYDEVHFKLGYPSKEDADRIVKKRYVGYEMQDIKHRHFGNDGEDDLPVRVFAIRTTGEVLG